MRIAIIDGVNQDIGIKILFPEADYFINNTEIDKSNSFNKYNIHPNYDWSTINDQNYDYLFIVISSFDAREVNYNKNIYDILNREKEIINKNNFKKVFVFDNYDYDYDPNEIWNNDKITLFFKRNYNKKKIYKKNVVSFPFIMFGEVSLIEKCDTDLVSKEQYFCKKYERVFFSGCLLNHQDFETNIFRNRQKIYQEICHTVYNSGYLPYNLYLEEIKKSKYGLDLLGVGEPNKRTFEILLSGSLMIQEKNDLLWPFEETFCYETQFKDSNEYFEIINKLSQDETLYNKCIEQQYNIVNKYFNVKWIKEYLLQFLHDKTNE